MHRQIVLVLVASLPIVAPAATFSVGSDPACTHATIQSAIDAAGANAIGDQIILAAPSFSQVELNLTNDSIAIRGGFASCGAVAPTGRTRLVGRNDAASRVLAVTNTGLPTTLDLVVLDVGREAGEVGGGISVSGIGPVVLTLTRSSVSGHDAVRGAGIDLSGPLSSFKTLRLAASVVSGNRATTGGGVYCSPGAVELGVGAAISSNDAQYGGGVAGKACQVRLVGDATTRVAANTAQVDGGGVYVFDAGAVGAWRSPGATSGPVFEYNVAGGRGGAVYIADPSVTVVMTDAVLRGNRAGDSGGAIYAVGSDIAFDRNFEPCEPGACRVIADNHAGTNPKTRGQGGVIALVRQSQCFIRGQYVAGNSARVGALVHAEDGAYLVVSDSVLARNYGADELYWSGEIGYLNAEGTTIADNLDLVGIADGKTIAARFEGLILTDPVSLVPRRGGSELSTVVDCAILDPATPLLAFETRVARIEDPGFIDATAGNYDLRDDAPAIDFCANATTLFDLRGHERGFPYRGNPELRFDVGAFERTPLFADGFEVD